MRLAKAVGLSLAPAYDLVAGLVYADMPIEDSMAMAIGDAFTLNEVSTYEWANMAVQCGLPPALVQKELFSLASKLQEHLAVTAQTVILNLFVLPGYAWFADWFLRRSGR